MEDILFERLHGLEVAQTIFVKTNNRSKEMYLKFEKNLGHAKYSHNTQETLNRFEERHQQFINIIKSN